MDQKYLLILASLIWFFCIVLFYLKKKQSFGKLEQTQPLNNKVKTDENVNNLDTRYDYPNTPPVNPSVYKTLLVTSEPVNKDLYDGDATDTNQLNYSGGSTQLLKIPLQFNEPYNEQLRSQEVLITPYNRIKYNINGNC